MLVGRAHPRGSRCGSRRSRCVMPAKLPASSGGEPARPYTVRPAQDGRSRQRTLWRRPHARFRDRLVGPHADRQALGSVRRLHRDGPRRRRDQGRARARRRRRRSRSTTCSWARCSRPARARSPPARPRSKAGIPMTRARDDHQQGVPLGHQRDLPRRPDDPGRRRRGRGRRRHGVDDQGAVPPPEARARATAWATAS